MVLTLPKTLCISFQPLSNISFGAIQQCFLNPVLCMRRGQRSCVKGCRVKVTTGHVLPHSAASIPGTGFAEKRDKHILSSISKHRPCWLFE